MKKIIVISPTFLLFIGLLAGLLLPRLALSTRTDFIAYSMTGLVLYCFFTIFIYGLGLSFHSQKKFDRPTKLLFGYLSTVLVLVVFAAIFLMGHH